VPHATGIVANPANGLLFVSSHDGTQIREVDPIPRTSTVLYQGAARDALDGLTISADENTLYATRASAEIVGIDTAVRQIVFASGGGSGYPDGVAIWIGPLAGDLFVNTTGGTVVQVE
jgi:hypothetical protein